MSQTKVQLVSNIVGNVSGGASFTGIVTAAGGFSGSITGTASTASFATTSFGLSGSPNITIGNLTGVAATFTGNVSIAGTLTYEDVTNVDAVGLITARTGVKVTAGGVDITAGGLNVTAGVSTFAGITTITGQTLFAKQLNVSGVITATSYKGDGSGLTGVSAGLELKQAGSSVGTAITQVNFASGATLTTASAGVSTITIAAGINTTASSPSANTVVTLSLSSAQHHELTLTAGITTITCSGGSFGDSHSVVLIQPSSGIATVGFSTYFLFPSGSSPVMSSGSGKIDLVSFVVRRAGSTGIATQLLASAGLDYQ